MDPNANLLRQLELAETIFSAEASGGVLPLEAAAELAELVLALDTWLQEGGFLPERWAGQGYDPIGGGGGSGRSDLPAGQRGED